MPIPFRDAEDVDVLSAAAFLTILPAPGGGGFLGALFLINTRGEPLEFVYNQVETPSAFLWRPADLRRHAERTLATSLMSLCDRTPRLLLCLADEVGAELFGQDVRVAVPVGRIGQALSPAAATPATALAEPASVSAGSDSEMAEPLHLFWYPAPPIEDSPERHIFDRLRLRHLLLEPFERAARGLQEVYLDEPEEPA